MQTWMLMFCLPIRFIVQCLSVSEKNGVESKSWENQMWRWRFFFFHLPIHALALDGNLICLFVCLLLLLLHRSSNKWEMCVMNEKFPSWYLFLLWLAMPAYNFMPVRFLCFFSFRFFRFVRKKKQQGKVRLQERDKNYLWFEKGELCKVLFYWSLKNLIMFLFMSDKSLILRHKRIK